MPKLCRICGSACICAFSFIAAASAENSFNYNRTYDLSTAPQLKIVTYAIDNLKADETGTLASGLALLDADIIALNESSKEIGYVPSKFNDIFPLRITSALVTELSPLILLLKSNPKIKTLCYEEPEMCLHPKYQELIARVLIKLVNKNINIIATTHSDIILQHINNMGVLSKVDEDRKCQIMEKFSFNNNDLINLQRINVYQLSIVDNVTKVKKIEVNKLGFDVHSFSDVLSELLKKSLVINRSIEGKND